MTHDEVEFAITTPVPAKRDVARQTKASNSGANPLGVTASRINEGAGWWKSHI
jgi:hypothetical protein